MSSWGQRTGSVPPDCTRAGMRDPISSAKASRRFSATRTFVIRTAKRLASTGSGHACPRSPYPPEGTRFGEYASINRWQNWIHRHGVTRQGIAPRCADHRGCYGQKVFTPKAAEIITVEHLREDAAELAAEGTCDLSGVCHHARSRLCRMTHKAASGRSSRKRAHLR